MSHNNERVFWLLEQLNVPLADRMYLNFIADEIEFSSTKLSEGTDDFDFFQKRSNLYYFIQNGEKLCINHIDWNKNFVAYSKTPDLFGTHELLYYVPSSQKLEG